MSRKRHDNSTLNLEVGGALPVACGRPLTLVFKEMKSLFYTLLLLVFLGATFAGDKLPEPSAESTDKIKKISDCIQKKKGTYHISFTGVFDDDAVFDQITIGSDRVILAGKEKRVEFKRDKIPEEIDFLGKFKVTKKGKEVESYECVTRRKDNYDFSSLTIYHDFKEYDLLPLERQIPYVNIDNTLFVEEGGYFYVIKEVRVDETVFIDSYGDMFSEIRSDDISLPSPPAGYKSL